MDPPSFGGAGNASRINYSFDFFMKPDNDHLLKRIMGGEIVKLSAVVLNPNLKEEPYTYFYREVSSGFEAVKLAYGYDIARCEPEMRFIQIWVDGDDYALTDDYYRGGVTW